MEKQRNSKQRQLILDAVKGRCDHPTADQIYLEVREKDEKISRGTVYRNLGLLSENGQIANVKVPAADRYDLRTDYHYHLVCTCCGRETLGGKHEKIFTCAGSFAAAFDLVRLYKAE